MAVPVFAEQYIHHVAIRVPDAESCKDWLATMLGLQVRRQFEYNGLSFIFMAGGETGDPIIEVIGGQLDIEPDSSVDILAAIRKPGLAHICFHVENVEDAISSMKKKKANVLIDMLPGPPGSGVKKAAFVADPWGNIFEFVELTDEE
jgi:catechol 2,3-dioxygenase-like lactoylglutathione lyase family enzyme